MRNEFYNETNGVLLVYDVTDRDSFGSLQEWLDEMKNEMDNATEMENCVFIVCANKVQNKSCLEVKAEKEGKQKYMFRFCGCS